MCVMYNGQASCKKRKNSLFTKKKSLVGLAPGGNCCRTRCFFSTHHGCCVASTHVVAVAAAAVVDVVVKCRLI